MEVLLSADQGSVTGYYCFELIKSNIRDSGDPFANIVHVLQGLLIYHSVTRAVSAHISHQCKKNGAKCNQNTTRR
jgi:hypothetical protein